MTEPNTSVDVIDRGQVFRIKALLTGLSGVGKTCTLKALDPRCSLVAEEQREPSITERKAWKVMQGTTVPTSTAPNFGVCTIEVKDGNYEYQQETPEMPVQDKRIFVYIFDPPAQQFFYQFRKDLAEGTHGVIFVIDSTSPIKEQDAVTHLIKVFVETMEYIGTVIPVVILANKQDLTDVLPMDKIFTLLEEFGLEDIPIFETIATKGEGIGQAIECLAKMIVTHTQMKFTLDELKAKLA